MPTPQWHEHTSPSPSGWLWGPEQRPGHEPALGLYIDYGPRLRRTGHGHWCTPSDLCGDCQPGAVLAVLPRAGHRYCRTVQDAKTWIESQVWPDC